MGLFDKLFKNNSSEEKVKISTSISEQKKDRPSNTPQFHTRGKPDDYGLYPSELVMLAVAEKYKVSGANFPGYLTYTYEVSNPLKTLKNLQSKGFLEEGSPKDALPGLKIPELKEIAASLGVVVKGKKADIVKQLSEIDEEQLSAYVKERTWKLTESGHAELDANPYIQFFLDKHPYELTTVGVDLWTVNADCVKNPKRPYRDIIYRQLNNEMNKASRTFQKNSMSGTADTYKYCECLRVMGLFIEEEGKSYTNASDLYFQYLFNRINLHAGLQLLESYKLFKNNKEYQDKAIARFYDDIQLYPFHRAELLRLIDELDIDGEAIREALIASFKRAQFSGIMSENEAADFIIFEMNGETDKSREYADDIANKAVNKIK